MMNRTIDMRHETCPTDRVPFTANTNVDYTAIDDVTAEPPRMTMNAEPPTDGADEPAHGSPEEPGSVARDREVEIVGSTAGSGEAAENYLADEAASASNVASVQNSTSTSGAADAKGGEENESDASLLRLYMGKLVTEAEHAGAVGTGMAKSSKSP